MITIITCWYILKSKFNKKIYSEWMGNFLLNVKLFNLIIFTNNESKYMLDKYINNNPNIKIIIKPIHKFYNYKYKSKWVKNHSMNYLLNKQTNWELNMLWSEKISFIKDAYDNNYFNNINPWYCWCDIGYFRCRHNDIPPHLIRSWPNIDKINKLNINKIHYANTCNNIKVLQYFKSLVNNTTSMGLPKKTIPHDQNTIAGGFFLIHKDKINWWHDKYDKLLCKYFDNNYLVKDDQIIIVHNFCLYHKHFKLYMENNHKYDNWFMFQRILL